MNDVDSFSSKVYYHLGAYEDSLTYALGAGDLFDVNGHSEYVETIIGIKLHVFKLKVYKYTRFSSRIRVSVSSLA